MKSGNQLFDLIRRVCMFFNNPGIISSFSIKKLLAVLVEPSPFGGGFFWLVRIAQGELSNNIYYL